MRRTRRALLNAFSTLVQKHHYDEIRVADITGDADVGRSTFYEHYAGKDDIMLESMTCMLDILARCPSDGPGPDLEPLLNHYWENRSLVRYLLAGPPSETLLPRITRELAGRIEASLARRCREQGATPIVPLGMVALQISEAQMGLLRAWVSSGEPSCTPRQIAEALRRSSRATAAALLGGAP